MKYLILLLLTACVTTQPSLREKHKEQLLQDERGYTEAQAEHVLYIWSELKKRFKCEEHEKIQFAIVSCIMSSDEAYEFWIRCSFGDCQ